MDVEELLDIYTTRGLLEEQAARLAIRHLTSKDVSALERLATSIEAVEPDHAPERLWPLYQQFHLTIYRASKRPYLVNMIEELWKREGEMGFPPSRAVASEGSDEVYLVRAMLSACKLRDEKALGLLVRYQVRKAASPLLEQSGFRIGDPPASGRFERVPSPSDVEGLGRSRQEKTKRGSRRQMASDGLRDVRER